MLRRVALVFSAGLIVALAIVPFVPIIPDRESRSPDGAFTARASVRLFDTLVPMMPGQGGDKPGVITVYDGAGRSCGSAPVPMVWMIQDIRWTLDPPRQASIVALATWDLDACTVRL